MICRSWGLSEVGEVADSAGSWHFGSVLQVSNLGTIPGTGPYARQAGNVICDGLTSRAPDPHRSPYVFVAYRPAGDQLLGPQPPQEPAVQVQGDGFSQIGRVAGHQHIRARSPETAWPGSLPSAGS